MLVTSTGWSFPQVDALPLPEVWELFEYWNGWPPAHVLLRGFTGYTGLKAGASEKGASEKELGAAEVSELSAMLGPAGKAPPHIAEMVAWAEQMKTKIGNA
jgi:hypothetical protein